MPVRSRQVLLFFVSAQDSNLFAAGEAVLTFVSHGGVQHLSSCARWCACDRQARSGFHGGPPIVCHGIFGVGGCLHELSLTQLAIPSVSVAVGQSRFFSGVVCHACSFGAVVSGSCSRLRSPCEVVDSFGKVMCLRDTLRSRAPRLAQCLLCSLASVFRSSLAPSKKPHRLSPSPGWCHVVAAWSQACH